MGLNAMHEAILEAFPKPFGTILIDPPWRFTNRTGKMAPEHKRLHRIRIHCPKNSVFEWFSNSLKANSQDTPIGGTAWSLTRN
jgi:hypothetical protein